MRRAGNLENFLETLDPHDLERIIHDWPLWARKGQLPPRGNWTTWLILGGRGAGKTRAGAEWVRDIATRQGASRIALIGRTIDETRSIMVEGPSGLLDLHGSYERPAMFASRGQLFWSNGSVGQMISAETPDALRGHQFTHAWCDEVCKWRYPDTAWDMLQFALRAGQKPQQVVTTTPRPMSWLKARLDDKGVKTTRMKTMENRANLAPASNYDLLGVGGETVSSLVFGGTTAKTTRLDITVTGTSLTAGYSHIFRSQTGTNVLEFDAEL